ncbi:sensor histidine kinase [Novosphingobium aureum]|uniref:sensor histidine kinase n=1 Tax=Novosphingobium aureum TaxID=2792964 RepID=UPI002B479EFC|nr:ATP-binding protein [Novosphingobium aureum]
MSALLVGAFVAFLAGRVTQARFTQALRETTLADARIRQALLDSEVNRFRLLPLALADDRDVIAALAGKSGARERLNRKFEAMAADVGTSAIYLVNCDGLTIAADNWNQPTSFVGENYGFRRYVRDALDTGSGSQFALGTVSRRPGLYLARRTQQCGVVVVKLEFDRLETQWRRAGGVTFVTAPSGVILATSEPTWRFAATRALPASEREAVIRDSGTGSIHPSPFRTTGLDTIELRGETDTAQPDGKWLLVSSGADAETGNWRLHLAMPFGRTISGPVRLAQVATGLAATGLVLALGWLAMRNRRRRARTLQLERAVAERTRALRREIDARGELEARAAQLREELRLANRLATLGQVTASVAHETSQPVAAIRNYAHVTRALIARGLDDEATENLTTIDRLAERIGVVTAQLRGFARKRSGALTGVSLARAIEGSELMLRERLSSIATDFPEFAPDLMVHADKVRLEQILVNLLQNAIEALAETAAPRITLSLDPEAPPGMVVLLIADNGPGIAPEIADKLFTPFTTSRSEGLGLGLVIAQDIATEFGGSLEHRPAATGTIFALSLKIAS